MFRYRVRKYRNPSLDALTACDGVMLSSRANFVLKSCLARVRFDSLLRSLCASKILLLLLEGDHLEPSSSDYRIGEEGEEEEEGAGRE